MMKSGKSCKFFREFKSRRPWSERSLRRLRVEERVEVEVERERSSVFRRSRTRTRFWGGGGGVSDR